MKFLVGGYKIVRLENMTIEASSVEEAKGEYAMFVNNGDVEISNAKWKDFSPEDCDEPVDISNQ